MKFRFLEEDAFYSTFVFEISEVQCGDHYDENNPQHVTMFEVKEKYRSKGYGTMLCKEAEAYLRSRGAACQYTDTPDAPEDRCALLFYVRYGFTPVGCHPGENGKNNMPQIYLFKYF